MSEEKKIEEMNVELSEEEMKEGAGGISVRGGNTVIMNPVILPGGGIIGR